MNLVLTLLLFFCFVYACFKRVNCYNAFVLGAKTAFPLAISIFPNIAAMLILIEVFRASGLSQIFIDFLSPCFEFLGIPYQLTELVIFRPFTGSGSIALLSNVFENYGADSYIGRCASLILGSSETVFYCAAVYFSGIRKKGTIKAVLIALFCSFVGTIFGCWLCKIM